MPIITGKDRYINRDRIRIAAHIFDNLFKAYLTISLLKIMFKFLPVFAILGISAVLVRMTLSFIIFCFGNKSSCLIISLTIRMYDF